MKRRDIKQLLIEAGLSTIHARGFNATGVGDITMAAGVPKGSFYNHFDSKETFGVQVVDEYWVRTHDKIVILEDIAMPPMERIAAHFQAFADIFRHRGLAEGCLFVNLGAELANQSHPVREQLATHFREWSRALTACIAEGQENGSIRLDMAASDIANFLINSWKGAILRAKVELRLNAFDHFFRFILPALRP